MGPHEHGGRPGAADAQGAERLADGVGALLERTSEPSGGLAVRVQPCGLPDGRRLEMRPVHGRSPDSLEDGQLPALEEHVELRERRVKSQRCVPDGNHLVRSERHGRPERAVARIGDRGQRVQTIVSAGELDDQQDAPRVGTQRRERKRERGEPGGTRLQKLASRQSHGGQLSWYSGVDSTR